MAMGSTSKVALNDEMQKAKEVCTKFRATVTIFISNLDGVINTLCAADSFSGEAAEGFKTFYNNNIKAFFAKGNTFDKYIGMFDNAGDGLFDSIEKALIIGEGLDPSLGNNNKSIGQNADGGTAG